LRSTAQEKRFLSKILLFVDNVPGHPRALMETGGKVNVFMDGFERLRT